MRRHRHEGKVGEVTISAPGKAVIELAPSQSRDINGGAVVLQETEWFKALAGTSVGNPGSRSFTATSA
jgi:hypothetical protein